jgi:hypothetical protein
VSKLNPAGSKLVYSTYLGGTNGIDVGEGITVDSSGDAYVVGLAGSSDFPTKPGAFQTVNNGGASPGIGGDGFVTEVKPDGTDLVFSTFLGGTAGDIATSVVVDSTGAIYVGGSTFSTDFPTKNPLQPTLNGNPDGFTTKFAPGGSTLDYSTYGGGTVVVADMLGDAYASGEFGGTGMYAKINPAGSALIYSAPSLPAGSAFAVDASENMYVAGVTNTAGLPVANAIQSTYNGGNDCYIGVVNLKTSAPVFASYLGGSEREFGCFAALDSTGHVYITGWTASINFPTLGGMQTSFKCCTNAFLTKIDLSTAATPVASVTPTNLTFQGTTGGMQTVTVKNTGASPLTISNIGFQVSSSAFSETDTCTGSAIAAGGSCSIDVTFTPQASGNQPGLLSITYNGTGSPQYVVLTVVDFSFTPSANSLTLKAGSSGTFSIPVLPLGGFTGTVNISCTGAPPQSSCAPSPSTVSLDGLHGGIVTVTVGTSAATLASRRAPVFPLVAGFTLPMGLMAFSLTSNRRRITVRPALLVLALLLASLTFLPSCGGGGGGGGNGGGGSTGTPPGTYTLTVTGSSGNLSNSTTVSLTVL